MNQLLDANYLGVHTLAVGQVKSTKFTRQINARGLNKVKLSIKTKGWVNSNTPYVLVPREQLPSGKDTVFSTELLGTLTVYCLDGNHRIQALLELEGAEFSVDCRLYLHFDCAETINALARSEYTYRIFVSSCRYVLDFVRFVCVFFVCVSSHSCLTSSSLDVPAGVTQEEGHIGFVIHLSAVRASICIFFVLVVVVVVDYRLYLQHHLFCFHSRGTSIL